MFLKNVTRPKAALAAAGILFGTLALAVAPASAATRLGGVNMQEACNTQWPALGLTAVVLNGSNAYSWRCTNNFGFTQGISVNAECVTQYGAGAYAGLGSVSNPYSWYCQR
jgi:hypothetical protein